MLTLRSTLALTLIGLLSAAAFADTIAERKAATAKQIQEMTAKFSDGKGGVTLAKMTDAEQKQFTNLQAQMNGLDTWELMKLPDSIDVSKFPPVSTDYVGKENITADVESEMVTSGTWRFMAFGTESEVPVPFGWEIYDTGYETHLFFPPVHMTINGPAKPVKSTQVVHLKFTVEEGKDFDAVYADLAAKTKEHIPTAIVGEKHSLPANAGYCCITVPQQTTWLVFSPSLDHPGLGYVCIATTTAQRWKSVGPVFETMMKSWFDRSGHPLAANFKYADLAPPSAQTQPQ